MDFAYAWPAMHDVVSDENLMLQYQDGDVRAFDALYTRYRQPLFRYLQHQCGNAAIAEELFQDIWLNLIRSRDRYQVSASFKTFIYHMAHNRLIDHYRKQKHGVPASYDEHAGLLNLEITADPVSAERQVAGEQQLALLHTAIAELPEAQREAFLLKENTGLSVEQIAEISGVNSETAKSRIRYAFNKLRQRIELDDHD
jgi:RNA polymerase sigma factor (sigma-70 family)